MKKKLLLILGFLCIGIALVLLFSKRNKVQTPDYLRRIDSIESELSIIKSKRDSVRGKIDTTIIKIKENERYYKETVHNIITNNVSDDYIFFTNYLKWNRERYDSINNSDSTERN